MSRAAAVQTGWNCTFAVPSDLLAKMSAMTIGLTIALIIVLINIVTFCVFWWDKDAARAGDWRVPENRLLGLALIGGVWAPSQRRKSCVTKRGRNRSAHSSG